MNFLSHIKLHTLKHLINAKSRDEVRGKIEAEKDLEGILLSIKEFDALVVFMETRFVEGAEAVLFERLMQARDPQEEVRIISQLKHTRKLQKQFMKYVKNSGR